MIRRIFGNNTWIYVPFDSAKWRVLIIASWTLKLTLWGYPIHGIYRDKSIITLLNLVWRESDMVAMNNWKTKCVGLQRTWVSNTQYVLQGYFRSASHHSEGNFGGNNQPFKSTFLQYLTVFLFSQVFYRYTHDHCHFPSFWAALLRGPVLVTFINLFTIIVDRGIPQF